MYIIQTVDNMKISFNVFYIMKANCSMLVITCAFFFIDSI